MSLLQRLRHRFSHCKHGTPFRFDGSECADCRNELDPDLLRLGFFRLAEKKPPKTKGG